MANTLKHRAVCPDCGKGFDTRKEGVSIDGYLYCGNCFRKHPFMTFKDYIKKDQ